MNPIISEKVKQSLRAQDTCPKCGASWKELSSSLHESMDSPNWYIALTIIRNCKVCQLRFSTEVKILTGE